MRMNDAIIGVIAILVGIGVLVHVQTFPGQENGQPGPALFPSALAGLFIISGIVLIFQESRKKEHSPLFERLPELNARGISNILVTLAGIAIYILISETVGFLLTSFGIMVSLMLMLKAKIRHAIPVAAFTTVMIYIIFNKGLMVPLPRGYLYF